MFTPDPWEEVYAREQLHFAAGYGDIEKVSQLLKDGYQPDLFDEIGKTPLHYASENGHLDVMRLLLQAGADVNANDERWIGNTALREVADSCSFEVAKILVDAGADPTIPGWMQITALHKVQERKDAEGLRVHELLKVAAKRFVAKPKP
ncbi:MAG TPA: ankyrin repeat domain-containing protein [Pyrinomonadaceae bacterium]|jgi:ankyrin repeat protein|nr:ankyrin repeat domain-containing protein [Pyrinomonadaceae bacterium]